MHSFIFYRRLEVKFISLCIRHKANYLFHRLQSKTSENYSDYFNLSKSRTFIINKILPN